MDYRGILLISGVLTLLGGATAATEFLRRRPSGVDASTLATCRSRVNAWWALFGLLICSLLIGTVATVFFFFAISFWALREYVTLTPTRPADHRTLVFVFFLLTPIQFLLVGVDADWFRSIFGIGPYPVYSALIPTLAFLILPASVAASNDPKSFLERIAKLQVGLLICVYSLSFAPALLTANFPKPRPTTPEPEIVAVDLEGKILSPIERSVAAIQATSTAETGDSGSEGGASTSSADLARSDSKDVGSRANNGTFADDARPAGGANVETRASSAEKTAEEAVAAVVETIESPGKISTPRKNLDPSNLSLLFAFVFLTQLSDVAQYLWSLVFPKHKIAPSINSRKTKEGVALGVLTTALAGVGLWYFTPFPRWWEAGLAGAIVALMGFAGNMTMSAIKRDQGVGDFGTLIEGRNGVLDRVDSLCFAAPVFFHFVWICADC